MDDLKDWYRTSLAAKSVALRGALRRAQAGDGDAVGAIRRLAHNLRGSAAAYGFQALGVLAGEVEDMPEDRITAGVERLLAMVDATRGARAERARSLLIVDDDPAAAAFVAEVLTGLVGSVERVGSASALEARLEVDVPDLIVLDLILPDVDGRTLLSRLRAWPATMDVPVLVLSALSTGATASECFALGADAVFQKGDGVEGFVAAAEALIRHAGRDRGGSGTDPLTGLPGRSVFRRSFGNAVALARREGRSVSVGLIDFDHFKHVNDTYGHAWGDEVLRRSAGLIREELRGGDQLARWGGEEFVVILPTTDVQGAARALEKALERVRNERFEVEDGRVFQVTFSGGVAEAGALALEDVVAAADARLYRAKAAGRARIEWADDGEEGARQAAILLVEDDPDIVALVTPALRALDLRVDACGSVEEARERLAEGEDYVLAILDLVLPGDGGLVLLAELRRRAGWTARPVLILTGRNDDAEVVRAFDAGADEFVLKPCSPEALSARVRRALARVGPR